eukprot:jgi/Ulvmu1/8452/UM043_0030.1
MLHLLIVLCLVTIPAHAQQHSETFRVSTSSGARSSTPHSSSRSSRTQSRRRRSSSSSSSSSSSRVSVGGVAGISNTNTTETAASDSADFVIIGGGTAGCVIAARVCENLPHTSVVLLERGRPRTEEEELLVRAQPVYTESWSNPRVTQAFQTEPNPGLLGRRVTQLTGNTLGGSSAVVSVQWTKPPLATFDNPAWGFTGLDSAVAGDLYRRVERQLQVAQPPRARWQTYAPDYLAAAADNGLPTDDDPVSRTEPATDGVWITAVAVDTGGRRRDSCAAYLTPVLGPGNACAHNLRVIQSATVSRVVVEGGRAVGVRYLKTDEPDGKQEREIAVKKEVVSSAGPYGTPLLLQRSGLGPPAVLNTLGVALVADLPVGEDTSSRPSAILLDAYTAVPLASESNDTITSDPEAVRTFLSGGGGILAVSSGGTNGVVAAANAYTASLNIALPDLPSNLISAFCGINPTARGSVRARDTNPTSAPALTPNFLGNSKDLSNAMACIERLQEVRDTLQPQLGLTSLVPGPAFGGRVSPEFVRATSSTFFHSVSGCTLGKVVDADFKVKGVQGLRVSDSSVLPEIPPFAGPMSTVYIIAELAAEVIIAAHE